MAPRKQYVYTVTTRDFEDETDKVGEFNLVEIHAAVDSANDTAKKMSGDEGDEIEESAIKDGSKTFKNKSKNFTVQVKKMELMGDVAAANGGG